MDKNKPYDESAFLAECIYNIKHADIKTQRLWLQEDKTSWSLCDNIILERADDLLVWYIWKYFQDEADECYKVVPFSSALTEETMCNILRTQPWIYV